MVRAAFDIGGTFTDFVLQGPDGTRTLKVPTSQPDPADAVLAGFQRLMEESGTSAEEIEVVLHGTTVATNAIIERKGAKTALAGLRTLEADARQTNWHEKGSDEATAYKKAMKAFPGVPLGTW